MKAPTRNRWGWLLRVRPAPLAAWLGAVLRIQPVTVETAAGTFSVSPFSHFGNELIINGIYEPVLTKKIKENLPRGGVFIDVGANLGYYSVLASQVVGQDGRVVAIEPQSRLIGAMRENLRLNRCANVEVLCMALSDQPGVGTIHLAPSVNSGASSLAVKHRFYTSSEEVQVTTLDALIAAHQIASVDVIKIDVEGFEVQVLRGAHEALSRRVIRQLHIDAGTAPLSGYSPDDVHALIQSYGYVRDQPLNPCWYRAPD